MEGISVVPVPGDSNMGPSSSSGQTPNEIVDGRGKRDKGDKQALKKSALLNQIWKNDLDSGHLLVSLLELFGEGILSFIPAPGCLVLVTIVQRWKLPFLCYAYGFED
ncbi:transcription initiation factor tfiid subunit 6 [Quercus suber]|uniref:Transcription initiation factor tfiid subunit 6 n=1 Tax=Quercus suber TaxID=58331 RepID=A0AAW0J8J2_QUESU